MDAPTTPGFPEQIGRYRLLELVGSGGMGTVYRALDPQLDRVVALKVPHRREGPDEMGFAQRFAREARAAARVLHPNVCPIFDVGEHAGVPFVVMAFVEGKPLSEHLMAGKRYPVEKAVRIVRQVLAALTAVHAAGVVHRDVKPGNILITPTGQVVLTDFGLAHPEGESLLTSDGVILGTPAYMAPEQAAGNVAEVGPWTDLYAVGVVLFQMLAGRLPFMGTKAEVMAAVLRDEPPALRGFCPEAGPASEAVVQRALAKRLAERFHDARGLAKALGAWRVQDQPHGDGETTTAFVPVPDLPRQATRGLGWFRWTGWVLGFLMATLASGLSTVRLFVLLDRYYPDDLGYVCFEALLWGVAGTLVILGALHCWQMAEMCYCPCGLRRFAKGGWTWLVVRTVANGVPLDEPDEQGDTALMKASAAGQVETVKALLQLGARTDLVNERNETAAAIVRASGQGIIYDLLKQAAKAVRPPRYSPCTPTRARPRLCLLLAMVLGPLMWILAGMVLFGGGPNFAWWEVLGLIGAPLLWGLLIAWPVGHPKWFPCLGPHRIASRPRGAVDPPLR